MLEPGRTFATTSSYRYGFNGKEQDSILGGGTGIDYNYGFRIYDARAVRWFSVDPLQKKYAGESNYAFVSDNPIIFADGNGKDKILTLTIIGKDGKNMVIQKDIDKEFFVYSKINTPGSFNPNKYYKSDLYENITVDLRGKQDEVRYSEQTGYLKEISKGDYYIDKAKNSLGFVNSFFTEGKGGSQPGGIPLISEFGNGEGPDIKADHPDKPMNVDLLTAAINGFSMDKEASLLNVAEWSSLISDLVQTYNEKDNNSKSQLSPSTTSNNSKSSFSQINSVRAQSSDASMFVPLNNLSPSEDVSHKAKPSSGWIVPVYKLDSVYKGPFPSHGTHTDTSHNPNSPDSLKL